jgi:hypothetical protein
MDIAEQARHSLKRRPRYVTLEIIAADTGLSLGWLKAFAAGAFERPRGDKCERLLACLAERGA